MIDERIDTAKVALRITLTDKATPEQAMKAIDMCCGALRTAEASVERIRLTLGKLLVEVQDKDLFKPAFASFERWTQAVSDKHKLSRATLREAIMVARRLPNLTAEQAEAIPMTSLALAARAIKPGETDSKLIAGTLKNAAVLPISEFRKSLTEAGLIGGREEAPGYTTLRLKVADRVADQFNKLLAGGDPGTLLMKMMTTYRATIKAQAVEKTMTAGHAA